MRSPRVNWGVGERDFAIFSRGMGEDNLEVKLTDRLLHIILRALNLCGMLVHLGAAYTPRLRPTTIELQHGITQLLADQTSDSCFIAHSFV